MVERACYNRQLFHICSTLADVLPKKSTDKQDFIIKIQEMLANCQNEEYLLLKTTVIIDHLLNEFCSEGISFKSKVDAASLNIRDKWHVLKQFKKIHDHTAICMDLIMELQSIITADLYYSRFKFKKFISVMTEKYPAIADHSQGDSLLGAKYALTLFCSEIYACTRG